MLKKLTVGVLRLSQISFNVKENYSNFALDCAQSIKLLKWSSRLSHVMVSGTKVVTMVVFSQFSL